MMATPAHSILSPVQLAVTVLYADVDLSTSKA